MSQAAALEAVLHGEDDVAAMVASYDERRQMFVSGLNAAGLSTYEPKGAFYAFPSIARTGLTSDDFAEKLLYEERVAVVPGAAFGSAARAMFAAPTAPPATSSKKRSSASAVSSPTTAKNSKKRQKRQHLPYPATRKPAQEWQRRRSVPLSACRERGRRRVRNPIFGTNGNTSIGVR